MQHDCVVFVIEPEAATADFQFLRDTYCDGILHIAIFRHLHFGHCPTLALHKELPKDIYLSI